MFQKILACTDGSSYSIDAVEMAAILASKLHAEIKVLSVFSTYYAEPAYLGVWAFTIPQESIDASIQAQHREIEAQTKPVFERLGIIGETLQETGHPADCIVEVAKREHSDLIVMGSRGMGSFKSLLLGSVSDAVLHHAHCPVLILHGEHDAHKAEGLKRILLATDGSEGSSKAAHAALSLAQKFETPLTVVNVFEPFLPLPEMASAEGQSEQTHDSLSARVLEVVCQQIRSAAQEYGVVVSVFQERGDPAESLVRFADEHQFDLIVMGSRGLGTFKSLLLGSVSHRIAHHAHCPVLIVR